MAAKILFVFTSADKTLTGNPTGWYLPEAAHPYAVLAPHYTIDFAAPAGPNPPVDPSSVESYPADRAFLDDAAVRAKLASAQRLADVDPAAYAAVFYVGGHGPVLDLAGDAANARLASAFVQAGKVTAAVCHGTAALVGATDAAGAPALARRRVTGFSNAEEAAAGQTRAVPFLLEDRVRALGAAYEKADALWAAHVVVDGALITGQNPASAQGVGEAILAALRG